MLTIKRLDKQNVIINSDLVSAIKRKNVRDVHPNARGRYSWMTVERAGQENIDVTIFEMSAEEHERLLDKGLNHVLQEISIESEERKLYAEAEERYRRDEEKRYNRRVRLLRERGERSFEM